MVTPNLSSPSDSVNQSLVKSVFCPPYTSRLPPHFHKCSINLKRGEECTGPTGIKIDDIIARSTNSVSRDICGSQIGKIGFQPLELRELLRQHVQQIRAQDLDSYSQALSPFAFSDNPLPRRSRRIPRSWRLNEQCVKPRLVSVLLEGWT